MKIALTGRMRSGKDLVGDYLVTRYCFTRYALGDGVRLVCRLLYPEAVAEGKPRQLYQAVGQGLRSIDPNVWIKYVSRNIAQDGLEDIVITDVRQQNEVDMLRRAGFIIVRVNASCQTRLKRMVACGDIFDMADLNHETELHIDTFAVDYEIFNDGDMEGLYQQIERLLKEAA
ncbi:hypothetical protein Dtox_1885 [Desulfofarcimen acetoxidans DSM 771]|uniref:Uncharacterized protein n=1 Tax=Desulfofarcimen acetoxidans (strain ATCC 49208 / DSM 771 / KCTC 5769 / VKM B-1644 / 5575) TaxID=485916 RepID=C8VXS5_DESAS|nr:hypothetical protein [Desulfofarcimen acetoxidans]ACV62731.1 hypothetical protein Dtox_1885 [Desulfofarcimen acetoxidans DSM 771]